MRSTTASATLRVRVSVAEKAAAADQAWSASWAKACSDCWLGAGGPAPSFETVREILAVVADLGPALETQAGLADRIAKMEKDQADFAAEVTAIASALNLPSASAILDLAGAIVDRAHEANALRAKRDLKQQTLETAHAAQRLLAETLAIHAKRKAEMTAYFGVGALPEVAAKLQSIARKTELSQQAHSAACEILDALRSPTMGEAERAIDTANRAALEAEFEELKARFDDQDKRSRELFSEQSKAADCVDAVGGDDAVARIEGQRRTTLLEIADFAGAGEPDSRGHNTLHAYPVSEGILDPPFDFACAARQRRHPPDAQPDPFPLQCVRPIRPCVHLHRHAETGQSDPGGN